MSPESIADRQVHSFLEELAVGTQRYEQVRNLEGQVEREYRGRVVFELLQNAHDALPTPDEPAVSRRVRVVLEPDALVVANDGNPVSDADLEGLCSMAISTKDPSESIGNKGVGFRSTLDVSDAPEIYSRRIGDAPGSPFHGHSFRFNPTTLGPLRDAVEAFVAGDLPRSPFSDRPLVPTDDADRIRAKLRARESEARAADIGWTAAGQTVHLSPYALPVALRDVPPAVAALAAEGFATAVRLPFRDAADAVAVHTQIRALLEPTTLLFLDRIGALETVVDGIGVSVERVVTGPAPGGGTSLCVRERGEVVADHAFWLWSRTLGGASDPDGTARLRAAVAASRLPAAWNSVSEARLAVAVEASPLPRPGRYSVFLPTNVPTGSGAFINAPLSASLNRESIGPDVPLNALLLAEAAALAADAVRDLGSADASDAVVSGVRLALVAPSPVRPPDALDAARLVRDALGASGEVSRLALVGTDAGWAALADARVVEHPHAARVLTARLVQQASPVPAVHAHLVGPFVAIARAIGRPHAPSLAERVRIAEAAVAAVASPDVDWNAVVDDLADRFPNARDLDAARVLPSGDDGALASPKGPPTLFFPSQRDQGALAVPAALQDRVAFLSPRVHLQTGGQPSRATPQRDYLRGVVQEYAADRLLREVVRPVVPRTPLALGSPEAERWATILQWAVPLVALDTPAADLNAYPVPCRGGWRRAGDAAFGPGWDDVGQDLDRYLRAATQGGSVTAAHARDQLVLPPEHPEWGGHPLSHAELTRLGVATGVRLVPTPWDWDIRLSATYSWIPESPPRGITPAQWQTVCTRLYECLDEEGGFVTTMSYRLGPLWTLPGLDAFDGFGEKTLRRLARLVTASVAGWPDDGDTSVPSFRRSWRNVVVNKPDGDRHRFVVPSPLAILLESLPWFATAGAPPAAPSERWLLPVGWLADRDARRYDYLRPVPADLAAHRGAARALEALGAGRLYDAAPSPDAGRFLDAVADGLADGAADERTIRSHARDGWDHLDPADVRWPRRVVCRDHGGRLRAVDARTARPPVFFPDGDDDVTDVLLQQGHAVVIVDPKTARALALPARYAGSVLPTSTLDAHVLADGTPWDVSRAAKFPAMPSGWLAEVALAAYAYGGSGQGVQTAAFATAATTLHRARLVQVKRLETVLVAAAEPLSDPVSVGAHWDGPSSTLLVARGAPLHALVDPIQSLLGRRDLHASLRLALDALARTGATVYAPPDDADVATALATLRIDADRLDAVRRHFRGDLALTHDRALAAVALLAPSALDALRRDDSERAIRATLAQAASDSLTVDTLWDLCRTVRDDETLGRALWTHLGDQAELRLWNAALARLDRPPVLSASAPVEALAHVRTALPLARAALRHGLLLADRLGEYDALAEALREVTPPAGLDLAYWSPPVAVATLPLARTLHEAGVDRAAVEAFATPDARAALLCLGVDVTDPAATREENASLAAAAVETLTLVAAALGIAPGPFPDAAQHALREQGVASRWTDAHALRLVASHTAGSDALHDAARTAASLRGLLDALGLTAEALDTARADADARADAAQRTTRTLGVCGKPFDAFRQDRLWAHLVDALPDDRLPQIALDRIAPLQPARKKRAATSSSPPPPTTSAAKAPGAGPQWKKDLVGAAGEMVVFRTLQKRYGPDVVRPEAWRSSARTAHYPGDGDDSLGYDLAFDYQGTQYLVEVKSTVGEGTTFEMGPSEVRAAGDAVRAKGVVYLVARVDDALGTPRVTLLTNPYEHHDPPLYRIEARGAVVTFRREG